MQLQKRTKNHPQLSRSSRKTTQPKHSQTRTKIKNINLAKKIYKIKINGDKKKKSRTLSYHVYKCICKKRTKTSTNNPPKQENNTIKNVVKKRGKLRKHKVRQNKKKQICRQTKTNTNQK